MLLGRRRRTDIYPDADTFFTARTGRRLWSSRRISEDLVARRRSLDLPADIPDFIRPLLVWKAAFETTSGDGPRLFGDRYALVRLEDLRDRPARRARARSTRSAGRPLPGRGGRVGGGRTISGATPRSTSPTMPAGRGRRGCSGWSPSCEAAGYGEILELEPEPGEPLDLTPPAPRSRLAGFMGRARGAGAADRRRRSAGRSTRLRRVKARVLIRPKEGILDPQGKAVERALPALGFEGISPRPGRPHGRARGRGRRRPRPPLRAAARQPTDRGLRDRAMRFGVLQFPGSCDERDAVLACQRVGDAELVWHGDERPLRPRRGRHPRRLLLRRLPARRGDRPLRARDGGGRARSPPTGGPVLGICNGFQVLCEAGLLPGRPAAERRACASSAARSSSRSSTPRRVATGGCEVGERLSIPVKHMSGRWFAPPSCSASSRRDGPDRLPLRAGPEPQRLGRRRRRGLQRARQRRRA